MNLHKTGQVPLKIKIISKENMVSFILFDNITNKNDLDRLRSYLATIKCNPMITYNPKNEAYGAWIFTEVIHAKEAKRISREIIKNIYKIGRIKHNYDIYPHYVSYENINKYSINEITLPLYAGGQVLVNGQFTDDISELDIMVHDCSDLAEHFEDN
jgi:hypothetical protein